MDLLKTSNVDDFCRLCLRGDGEIPVFTNEMEPRTSLSQKILECVSVKIFEGDKLPSAVCKLCLNNVNSWYDFKETCDKTQKMLHLWLKNQQPSTPEKEDSDVSGKDDACISAITTSSENANKVTESEPCSVVESAGKTFSSSDIIEIDSDEEPTCHPPNARENSAQMAELPVVNIKIESTQSLSMDAFNNYNSEGNCTTESEALAANGAENVSNTGNEDPISSNVAKVTPFQLDVLNRNGKRKRELSPPKRDLAMVKPCREHFSFRSEDPITNENSDFKVEGSEHPKSVPARTTEQSDNVSVSEVPMDSTSEGSLTCHLLPGTSVKQEPINDDDFEGNINFAHVKIKSEIPDEFMEEEGEEEVDEEGEGDINNISGTQENNEMMDTLCVVCNRNYTSRANLLRHMKSKVHKKLCTTPKVDDSNREKLPRRCKSSSSFESDYLDKLHEFESTFETADELELTPSSNARRKDEFSFTCRSCNVSFRTRSERERHYLSIKHQTSIAKKKSLTDNTYLSDAQTPAVGPLEDEKIYACPVETCSLTFSSGLLLISHMKRHGIISNMSKELISSNFVNPSPSPSSLSSSPTSVLSVTKSEKKYVCHKCHFKFNTPVGRSNHLRYCKGSSKMFLQSKVSVPTDEGRKNIDDNDVSSKYCSICNLHISDDVTFMTHMEMYHKGSSIHQSLTNNKVNQFVKQKVTISKISRRGVYKCKICSKSFNFVRALQLHLKQHIMEGQTHTCKVCKRVFIHVKNFRKHLRKHFLPDGSKQLLCITCYQAFDSRSDIAKHKRLGKCCAIRMKIYSCNVCNHSFNRISSLDEHKASCHGKDQNSGADGFQDTDKFANKEEQVDEKMDTYCNICQKEYASKSSYSRHLKCHDIPRTMDLKNDQSQDGNFCSSCSIYFPNRSVLEAHQSVCQAERLASDIRTALRQQFTCKHCDKGFLSNKNLKQHLLLNCPVFVKKCKKCLKCGKYVLPELLNRDWSCKYCTENLTNKNLTQPKPGGDRSILYQCPVGKKQFMSRSSMMNHYSSCNGNCSNTAAFFCKVCKERYSDIHSYNEHKVFCQKHVTPTITTTTTPTTTEHFMKMPTPELCNYCGRTFSRRQYRVAHEVKCQRLVAKRASMDTARTNSQFVHPCDVCNAQFRNAKLLAMHRRKYRKQCNKVGAFNKIYACHFCSHTNLLQTQLYKHTCYCIKKFLKSNTQVVCQTCNREFTNSEPSKEFSLKVQGHILDCLDVPYHPKEKPDANSGRFICLLCGFVFVSTESLKIHSSTVHHSKRSSIGILKDSEPGPVKEVEPIEMIDPANVLTEEQEHNVNMPMVEPLVVVNVGVPGNFPCPYCSKTFHFLKSLVLHKSTKHPVGRNRKFHRNKALQCKVCSRQFFNLAKLKNHEKVHGIIRENVLAEIDVEADKHSIDICKQEILNPKEESEL